MNVTAISTSEEALRKICRFAASERTGVFSETRYILINLKSGFTPDAVELIKKEIDALPSYELLVFANLDTDRELAALLVAELKAGCLTSCSDISVQDGTAMVKREIYGGLAHLNLSVRRLPVVITLSDSLLDAIEGDVAEFSPDVLNVETTTIRSKILSTKKIEKTVDLQSAKIIVSCGRRIHS